MKERFLLVIVAVLSVLAVQDRFSSGIAVDFSVPQKSVVTLLNPDFNKTIVLRPSRVFDDTKSVDSSADSPTAVRIIDGDTIVALANGVQEKVRLIGVDTPEIVDTRKSVQCFGKEASAFVGSLLLNRSIHLEGDSSQGDRDKYGRLLRYVFLADGTFINQKIIAEGYGHEYTYRTPYRYRDDFKNAEHSARELQKGLWANGVCGLQTRAVLAF